MAKNLFFAVCIALVSGAFTFVYQDKIDIAVDVPSEVQAGKTFEVTLKILKGNVNSFTKIIHELPAGFTAKEIKSSEGTFTFAEGRVKLLWLKLPEDKAEVIVKYEVTVPADASGEQLITGKFLYIQGTERVELPLEEKRINVINSGAVASTESGNTNEEASTETASEETAQQQDVFSCTRTVKEIAGSNGSSFEVRLKINKGKSDGFGRIQEEIPAGFSAKSIESKEGIFTLSEGKAKFLWMQLPQESEFEIAYELIAKEAANGSHTLQGLFSFYHNSNTEKIVIEKRTVKLNRSGAVASSNARKATQTNTTDKTKNRIANNRKVPVKTNTGNAKIAKDPDMSMFYKVQICAVHKYVKPTYFKRYNNVQEEVTTDMHQGWHKYMVGKFRVYKQARDHREVVRKRNKIVGPFVTAYNNGKRITVQEALMISNQKWYQ